MTYETAMKKLSSLKARGIALGLDNITALMQALKNPHREYKVVHVGGTNGKGTTTTMIANILTAHGYKVGCYLSPHAYDFRERIQINGEMIPKTRLAQYIDEVMSYDIGTHFEVTTAIAFKYFADEHVDYAVIEVGLGGRLDATNIVQPVVSVVTNVDLEHTDLLGKNIRAIAKEKAGIVKTGVPFVCGETKNEAVEEFKKVCKIKNAPIYFIHQHFSGEARGTDTGTHITVRIGETTYDATLPMVGEHHGTNASLALMAVSLLGFPLKPDAVREGFSRTKLPARFEIVERKPYFIYDGAHNPAAIDQVARALYLLKYKKLITVVGIMNDKAIERMAEQIASFSDKVIVTRPNVERAADPKYIAEQFKRAGKKVLIREKVSDAISEAKKLARKDDAILVTGSFYLVAEASGNSYDFR